MSRLRRRVFCGNSPPPSPAIAIALSNAAPSLAQAGATTVAVTLTRTNFTSPVALTVTGLPSGVTGTFSVPTLIGGTLISVLTLNATLSAPVVTADAFSVLADGGGGITASANATVTVTAVSNAPTWMDDFTGYADTAALQAVLAANSVYRSDSIDKTFMEIDPSVTFEGHPTLKYRFPAPQTTPQLVKGITPTTNAWMQVPIRWMYGWSTVDAAYGYYQGPPKTIAATSDVNTAADTITIASHGLTTGARIGYRNGGGTNTSIGGLSNNSDYYVIAVDANTIKLATSSANATNGVAIDLTSQGTVGTGAAHFFATVPSGASYKMMGFGTVNDSRTIFISTNGSGDIGVPGNSQDLQMEGNIPITGGSIVFHSPGITNIGNQFYTNTFWVYTYHAKKVNNDCWIAQGWIHEYGTSPSSGKYVHIRWQGVPGQNRAHSFNTLLINRNFNCWRLSDRHLHIGHIKYWDGTVNPDPLGLGGDESVLPYFTTSTATPNVSLARGSTASFTLDINKFNGWNGAFGTNVNADGSHSPMLPAGVTATFSPSSPSAAANSITVTLTATVGATVGTSNHPFFISGSYNPDGSHQHTCNGCTVITLTVT